MVKQRDLVTRFSELTFQFHYFLAVGTWTSNFPFLMSQFPLLKNRDNNSIGSRRIFMNNMLFTIWEALKTGLGI